MAQFKYETIRKTGSKTVVAIFDTKSEAIQFCKKNRWKLRWERWILIEKNDFTVPRKYATTYFMESELTIFQNNEQNTYRLCPWGGNATLLASDDKYDLYHTNKYEHRPDDGFYLVDNAPKRK